MDITSAVGKSINTNLGKLDIIKFLGKGKSGYSYLAKRLECQYVIKLIHYEPCTYYSFGDVNKVELEVSAYKTLENIGIKIPKLLDSNIANNYLVKEYIEGDLITELIIEDSLPKLCIEQVCYMSEILKSLDLNIDYFPDNFVLRNNILYYIDYEHNQYNKEWDLANWGLFYWANTRGMKAYKETQDPTKINKSANSGIPIKEPFTKIVNDWITTYC
ncbi:MAG: serine/threonine-protein kinase [Colwellia sp.]